MPTATHWKDPDAVEDRGQGGRERQRVTRLDGITDSMDMSLIKLREMVKDREPSMLQSTGSQKIAHHWLTEKRLSQAARELYLGQLCFSRQGGEEPALFVSFSYSYKYHLIKTCGTHNDHICSCLGTENDGKEPHTGRHNLVIC